MIRVGVTQRVAVIPSYGERRDCLDQNWSRFLSACGLMPVLLPNIPKVSLSLCSEQGVSGLVLTGGNDLTSLGGDAPERDDTESALLDMAQALALPVLGVCRGMQMLQERAGITLQRVQGHVTPRQCVQINDQARVVNSYHRYGAFNSVRSLEIWAKSDDGVVKAVRHSKERVVGIMWHPERMQPFSPADIELFQEIFGV